MSRRLWMRLAPLGLGLALALGALAPASAQQAPRVQVVHYNRLAFKIPLNVPSADIPRSKQFHLYYSGDGGGQWIKGDTTTLERPYFNFSARPPGNTGSPSGRWTTRAGCSRPTTPTSSRS